MRLTTLPAFLIRLSVDRCKFTALDGVQDVENAQAVTSRLSAVSSSHHNGDQKSDVSGTRATHLQFSLVI